MKFKRSRNRQLFEKKKTGSFNSFETFLFLTAAPALSLIFSSLLALIRSQVTLTSWLRLTYSLTPRCCIFFNRVTFVVLFPADLHMSFSQIRSQNNWIVMRFQLLVEATTTWPSANVRWKYLTWSMFLYPTWKLPICWLKALIT